MEAGKQNADSAKVSETQEKDTAHDATEREVDGAVAREKIACSHYMRQCKLKAPCCSKLFSCRFCHDEDSNHEMNRHLVQEVQCVNCDTMQPVSNQCVKCCTKFGEYFCAVCRLYDVDNQQFHCDKCGICRVGPREKFYHCEKCNACLSVNLKGKHKCVENMSMSSCPICQELLHTSRENMHIPHCGHMIHQTCLRDYFDQHQYQCPICKESLVDMTSVWKEMDQACSLVQMPEDLRNLLLDILCQDCHKQNKVPFNTEGLKCPNCGGYNTTQA